MTLYRAAGCTEREDVEAAISDAVAEACRTGAGVEVMRLRDRARIAVAWPDGKVDLSVAGSRVA